MKRVFTYENNQLILKVAATFNILLGILITFMPKSIFLILGVAFPVYIELWQSIGGVLIVSGCGYYLASFDSSKHWPIVLVGFLGNLLVSLIFLKSLVFGTLPLAFGLFVITGALFWTVPFYFILLSAYDDNTAEDDSEKRFVDLIKVARTSKNQTLFELSNDQNILLVFVRHFGCTFCRETVSELAKIDDAIKGKKLTPVFVHMSDPSYGDEFFSKYYSHPVHHVSDPTKLLYKSLNLKRGTLLQLFGPKTWLRGLWVGIVKGHGQGELEGDSLQLGGVFILSKGQIVFEQKANCASELFQFKTLPEI